jgi:hypothetical protein
MKKLLALLLVLGMSSLASATTVSLTDEGMTIDATPGDTVTLTISSDATPGIVAFDAIITVTGGDIISAAMDGGDADYGTYGWDVGFPIYAIGVGTSSVEIGGGNFMGNVNTIIGWVDVAYEGGTQVVDIAPGVAHGGNGDTGLNPLTYSSGVVTIVPEPMTIALLGLGGLALLRRRK